MRVHESMEPDVGSRGAVDSRSQTSQTRGSFSTGFGSTGHAGLSLLVVDHDRPKLEKLALFLRGSDRVREVNTAVSTHRALLRASRRPYDGVFLDMRMPELDGLEIISILNAFAVPPGVVVVSESDTHVAAAFRLGAVDYLIEPVTPERADAAVARLEDAVAWRRTGGDRTSIDPEANHDGQGANMFVVDGGRHGGTRLLEPGSILYLQAYGDYIRVFADSGRYLIRGRLSDAAMTLGADGFLRVHRKYLANLRRATGIQMLQNGTALLRLERERQVPVARRHVHELRQRLGSDLRSLTTTWHAAQPVHGASLS
jgi:two-component system, LytTR family, response regulator LytT